MRRLCAGMMQRRDSNADRNIGFGDRLGARLGSRTASRKVVTNQLHVLPNPSYGFDLR